MFYYLATPYSKYAGGIAAAFDEACKQAALLVRAGVPVFSPIAHSHPIAHLGEIDPMDLGIWLDVDGPMMQAAGALIVCKMKGWNESKGVAHEIATFRDAGKPIINMIPNKVPPVLQTDPRQAVYAAMRKRHTRDLLRVVEP